MVKAIYVYPLYLWSHSRAAFMWVLCLDEEKLLKFQWLGRERTGMCWLRKPNQINNSN